MSAPISPVKLIQILCLHFNKGFYSFIYFIIGTYLNISQCAFFVSLHNALSRNLLTMNGICIDTILPGSVQRSLMFI